MLLLILGHTDELALAVIAAGYIVARLINRFFPSANAHFTLQTNEKNNKTNWTSSDCCIRSLHG